MAAKADLVYVGSYPGGSVGLVKAANELGLKAKMFGGGMVGLQFAGIQKNLEKMPHQALAGDENRCNASQITNQLNLFDF